MGRDWLSDTTTVTLKSNDEIQAWCDRVIEHDRERKEEIESFKAMAGKEINEWIADVRTKYNGVREQYSALAKEFDAVGRMYNHAELVMHRIIVDDHHEGTLAYLERDLFEEAKAAKNELLRKWKPLEEHSATHGFTAPQKEKVLEQRRAVDTARTLMLSHEVAYWTAKLKSLHEQEENAARNAKIVKARRAQKHARLDFWEAHGALCKAGGGTRGIMHLMKRPFSEERMEDIKRTLYERVDEWEAERQRRARYVVHRMMCGVIAKVKINLKRERLESQLAALKAEQEQNLQLMKTLQPTPPPTPPPPPSPEAAVVVVDPKAKALEAVRKTNREKALKTATLLAQRKRAAKALEAEEKLAAAAAARAAPKAKARSSR